MEEHAALGKAAADVYLRLAAEASSPSPPPSLSASGEEETGLEVSDVLLAIASELSAQPHLFSETFTDAFETANKVAELLVHGLSGGKTECGCVKESSIALMDEAFRFADGEKGDES